MSAAEFTSLYRQILHLSKRLPDPVKRAAAVSAAQDKFRQHWSAGDDEAARAGLKAEAESRLGFLKMMTPSALHRGASRSGGRWLYRDGEKVSTDEISKLPDKAKWSNWSGSNMDPDSVTKHNALLNRAGFRDNAHAKGFF